jgi:ankyrin repeat protein
MRLRTLVTLLILVGVSSAQASTLRGLVIANELGGPPVPDVRVSAVEGANPTVTKTNGTFILEFPQKRAGDTIQLIVEKEGYVVVNDIELEQVLPTDAAAKPLTLLLSRKADREEMARRFYRLRSLQGIEESYRKRLRELEKTQHASAGTVEELRRERDQARSAADKMADDLAKEPDKTSELYREAMRFFLDERVQEAIDVLKASMTPEQSPEAARAALGRMSLQYTPEDFVESAKTGDLTVVKLFLAAGMDPNTTDDEGDSALMYAAYKGHTKVVEALVKAGADVKQRKGDHHTALRSAASGGSIDSVRVLLDKSPDTEAINDAFIEAVRMRHHEIVRLLAERGADVKKDGSIAMVILAQGEWGDEEVSDTVKLLLDLGPDPNEKDKEGWTALMQAADSGYPSAVSLLLDRGADVNAKCACPWVQDGGWTALMLATEFRRPEVVETLLGKGADVNQRNNRGETALILAAYGGDQGIFKAVLDSGADVNVRSHDGRTALMGVAAGKSWPDGVIIDYPEGVHALLAKGAEVNKQDLQGRTPLMLAAQSGSTAVVRTLLQGGAHVNEQDVHGNTALRFAQKNLKDQTETEMVRLLEEAGAK